MPITTRGALCMDIGTFLTTDPSGRLIAGALGWFGQQWLAPLFKRQALRAEYQQTTRTQRIELLVHLLGTLREHFTWLSGLGATDKPELAEARAREIDDWVNANHPRFPRDIARLM